jgi:hypothetical protein
MPLHPNAYDLMRTNLDGIRDRQRVHPVPVGTLSVTQVDAINAGRIRLDLNPIIAEVLFVGGHIYRSRILRDGYTVDDVIDQISSAMQEEAVVLDVAYMTAIENPNLRPDRFGNLVRDRAVFECSTRHPRPELISIVPRGDRIKPAK